MTVVNQKRKGEKQLGAAFLLLLWLKPRLIHISHLKQRPFAYIPMLSGADVVLHIAPAKALEKKAGVGAFPVNDPLGEIVQVEVHIIPE